MSGPLDAIAILVFAVAAFLLLLTVLALWLLRALVTHEATRLMVEAVGRLLIRRAVRRLEEGLRERYREEWGAEFERTLPDRPLLALVSAIGFSRAARTHARDRRREARKAARRPRSRLRSRLVRSTESRRIERLVVVLYARHIARDFLMPGESVRLRRIRERVWSEIYERSKDQDPDPK